MKRILSLLLVLLLALPSFTALAEEPIVLTTSRSLDATLSFDESDPEKRSFEENRWNTKILEELNVKLDYKWIATDGDSNTTKWSAAMASGDLPDFAGVSDTVYKLLVEMGAVADCTQLWNEKISDEYKALLGQNAVEQMTYDGQLLGLPWPTKGYHGANLLYVRQDWLDKLGLSYPQTWEEIVEVATAFQQAKLGGEGTLGLVSGFSSLTPISGLMNVFGAQLDYWVERDGKLAWSNIQPEMRTALLEIQKLYATGVLNPDVAVATDDLLKEYIASGKVGIFYGCSYLPTMVLNTLYTNDPSANVVSSVIKGVNGEDICFQTNTPVVGKIFVNAKCANLDKVAEVVNLVNSLTNSSDLETINSYSWDVDGFPWIKFNPFGDTPANTLNDLLAAHEITLALQAGAASADEYPFTVPDGKSWYEATLAASKGEGAPGDIWWYLTLGPNGTFTQLYDAYNAGLHLDNGYVGLPTATQELLGDIVNDQLSTAMQEVIMGADISVYDAACEAWLANGGQMITDEVNAASGR